MPLLLSLFLPLSLILCLLLLLPGPTVSALKFNEKPRYTFHSGMLRAYGIEKFHKNEPVWFSNYPRRRDVAPALGIRRFVQSVKYRGGRRYSAKMETIGDSGGHRQGWKLRRLNGISLTKKENRGRCRSDNRHSTFSNEHRHFRSP